MHLEKILVEIEDLEKKKKNLQNIKILQPPRASILPVKQIKTKRNMLLALIVAFFLEYINKYKNREKQAEG